jgi:hydrogenase maturation protein HypF
VAGSQLPITDHRPPITILAVGAHLKNTVAVGIGGQAFVSQHIGDLETEEAYAAFQRVIADLTRLHAVRPERIVCDLHPDYLSTRYAERSGLPILRVQHHNAHVMACMAENGVEGPALGVAWDGTGYGMDGAIWGGEFLGVDRRTFTRLAHLRPFVLPGGETAIREPRRAAFALLYELFGDEAFDRDDLAPVRAFSRQERAVLRTVLHGGLNAPRTTSMGRLFDAVASLTGIRQVTRYEGQAAIEFEAIGESEQTEIAYSLCPIRVPGEPEMLDWEPLVLQVLADLEAGVPVAGISARFHNALVEAILDVAHGAGVEQVILTGGCFLNRRLLESAVLRLQAEGFRPYWHQRIPPGDGGIALGQLVAAMWS